MWSNILYTKLLLYNDVGQYVAHEQYLMLIYTTNDYTLHIYIGTIYIQLLHGQ
jgi:hypothetical protein